MTDDQQADFNPVKRDIRESLRAWVIKIFTGPYLPRSLVIFFIVEGITFLGVALMSQPYGIWTDPSLSVNTLGSGPVEFLAVWLGVILVSAVAFSVVNYRLALFGWIITCITILASIGWWIQYCGFSRWLPFAAGYCMDGYYYTNLAGSIFIAILLAASFRLAGPKHTQVAAAPQAVWKGLVFPVAWTLILLAGVIGSTRQPSSGWLPINIPADKGPSPRSSGRIVYDLKLQRAVLFGGTTAWLGNAYQYTNDTWEWDGRQWTKMAPAHTPLARGNFGMSYDEKRGVVVLYGGVTSDGTVLADTWEWDGKDWKIISQACGCAPPARAWLEMIYDPQSAKTVVYGGNDNKGKFFSDGWQWDGQNWQQIAFKDVTPAASSYMLAYDPPLDAMLAILNFAPGGTWSWTGTQWTRLSPALEPNQRGGSGFAYEPDSKLVYLFGGWQGDNQLNDTWSFDGKDWKEAQSTLRPPALTGSMMFYDPLRKHIVLFGGYGQGKYHNEMWELVVK
jgi:hypothetical protein